MAQDDFWMLDPESLHAPRAAALVDPTVNDDISKTFKHNSLWTNISSDASFVCVDNTLGAAVWINITDPSGVLETSGTWTPELWDASLDGAEGQTYSARSGNWTKIGNMVFIDFSMTVSGLGTLTTGNGTRIGNLPFVAGTNQTSFPASLGGGLAITAGTSITGLISGTQHIHFRQWDLALGTTDFTIAELSADGQIIASGRYRL